MSSSSDVHTPRPLEINRLCRFFPEFVYREGELDPPPLGPFRVRGDYKVERQERDVPFQRFLILKPEEGCALRSYEYAIEYPEKLIAADLVTFERKGGVHRIRVQLTPPKPGSAKWCQLRLRRRVLPVHEYVLYEQQVEGTWIPIEADGQELKP